MWLHALRWKFPLLNYEIPLMKKRLSARTLPKSTGELTAMLGRACVLFGEDFMDTRQGVDFRDGFVGPETHDSRKAQRVTAVVPFGLLDIVESDFENDSWFDAALVAEIFDGVSQEVFGKLADFHVGQAGVGFADVDQALVVAHGEGVVGEEPAAFAVAIFGEGDHDIERGERALELHPELPTTPGNVRRLGSFGEQAFVADGESLEETVLDFFDAAAEFGAGVLQQRLLGAGEKLLQQKAPLRERRIEQCAVVEKEQVESHEAYWQLLAREEIDLLAAEALLELGEGNGAAIAPADDFAIEDEFAGNTAQGRVQLGEFGDAIERARVNLYLRGAFVSLGANPVELVFHEGPVREGGDDVGGRIGGVVAALRKRGE